MEEKEKGWVIGKMRKNQGRAESTFALVTQAYGIFTSHYIETNERAITIPAFPDTRGRKPWVIGKYEKRTEQGWEESPLNKFVEGKRKKGELSGYVWLGTVRK